MSFWNTLKNGLKKTSNKWQTDISSIFSKKKLDAATIEQFEEWLISTDMGPKTAAYLCEQLAATRLDKDITANEIAGWLSTNIANILNPLAIPLNPQIIAHKPFVVLVVGVNGAGKTTTIAKLAANWQLLGHKIGLVAGDTFRAAAVEQLQTWANRLNLNFYQTTASGDAAALAYSSYNQAVANGDNILIIDTAGRLHNKTHLMAELQKIKKVLQKLDPDLPHSCILVLDATSGQNTIEQLRIFNKTVGITGLIITKMDGTAKGGILVNIAQQFQIPIHAIGVGESADAMQPFNGSDFADALLANADHNK